MRRKFITAAKVIELHRVATDASSSLLAEGVKFTKLPNELLFHNPDLQKN